MKQNVTIIDWPFDTRLNGAYELKYIYLRNPRTFNEIKQNAYAIDDGFHVRGRRRKLPTSYDDIWPSQNYGRDWKRFTKRKHQWKCDRVADGGNLERC